VVGLIGGFTPLFILFKILFTILLVQNLWDEYSINNSTSFLLHFHQQRLTSASSNKKAYFARPKPEHQQKLGM